MDKKIILGLKLRKGWLLLLLETNWTIDRMMQQNEDFLTFNPWSYWKTAIIRQPTFSLIRTSIQLVNTDDAITDAQIFRSEISVSLCT